jgi:hypothetical protein
MVTSDWASLLPVQLRVGIWRGVAAVAYGNERDGHGLDAIVVDARSSVVLETSGGTLESMTARASAWLGKSRFKYLLSHAFQSSQPQRVFISIMNPRKAHM